MKPRDYVVRVVTTPAEYEASAGQVYAHSGAQAALSYALHRRSNRIVALDPLPEYTTLEATAKDGSVKTTYYLWANGSVSRTYAQRPVAASAH